MRYIIGILIVVLCSYTGYLFTLKNKEIKNFYESFSSFNEKLINEISFGQTTILNLIKSSNTNNFYKLITEYFNNGKFDKKHITFLSEDDKNFIYNYLKMIGSGDKNAQISYLESVKNDIKNKLNKAIEQDQKYSKLYIKMGFLLGLLIFVCLL